MKQAELKIRLKSQSDLARVKKAAKLKDQSLQKFGEDCIFAGVERAIANHEAEMAELQQESQ